MGRRTLSLFVILFLLSGTVQAVEYDAAEQAILCAFEEGAETLDLTPYRLTCEELESLFTRLRNENVLLWYASGYSCTYDLRTGIVHSVTFQILDEEAYPRESYEAAVQKILAEAVLPGMGPEQIAMSIHDYLISHFRYDESGARFTGYDLLVNGTAVCEGYARAYMDLLKRAGVEVIYVCDEELAHCWNQVKLDGNWHQVDVTWDDPLPDIWGRVSHANFPGIDISTDSPICFESAEVCYLRTDEGTQIRILRWDQQTGELTELLSLDAGYIDVGCGRYHYQTFGLSLWKGRLYFSDMERVYAMNTDGTGLSVVYRYDAEANGTFIRGSFVDEGILHLTLSDHDGNAQTKTLRLSPEGGAYSSSQNRSFSVRFSALQMATQSLMVGL